MTDWNKRLSLAGSENRAPVLVQALDAATTRQEKADLLREWFNLCDALSPERHSLRIHFDQVGWVEDETPPEFPCTVYRAGWEDDDVATGLSWTTEREVAEKFARILISPRGMFLGIYRDDVEPWIWQATCVSAFAYFNGRGEHEVVPNVLTDIEPVARLITTKKGA
jgi:hypothetical protein